MEERFPQIIGSSWAQADRSPPLLGVDDGRAVLSNHWQFMGLGGSESASPWELWNMGANNCGFEQRP